MTTKPSESNYEKFKNDFSNLQNTIKEYEALENGSGKPGSKDYIPGQEALKKNYETALGKFDATAEHNKDNPGLVMMAFMMLILGPGTQEMNGKTNLVAERFHFQSQFAKCQTDLQGITDSKDTGAAGSLNLLHEASGLNKLMGLIGSGSEGASILGDDGTAAIESNLETVRGQIYVGKNWKQGLTSKEIRELGNVQENNPENPTTKGDTPIYFSVGSPKFSGDTMSSYGEAIKDLAKQDDSLHAAQAMTEKTNAFSTNTSMLQSVQAGTKELISEMTNVVKTLESAGSSIGHSISQLNSTAINNQKGG